MHYDLLVSAGTHTPSQSLVFQNWGFIFLIGLEICGTVWKGFCMRWKTCQEERESVCPLMKDNVHECLKVLDPWPRKSDYCLLSENRLGIQPDF